jgi:hypothetical protein
MHKLIALTLLPALLLTGCPFGCGGYTGSGDRMFRRGSDALLLCDNGAYVAMFANGTTAEGRFEDDQGQVTAGDGPTGARSFTLALADDGTATDAATTDQLGGGTWTEDKKIEADQVALDHADVQCGDVTTRAWWNLPGGGLPVATAFGKPLDGYATVADCMAAQSSGTVPADTHCQEQLLMCPDGTYRMDFGTGLMTATYGAAGGSLFLYQSDNTTTTWIVGVYAIEGTFTEQSFDKAVWQSIPTTSLANGLSCQ